MISRLLSLPPSIAFSYFLHREMRTDLSARILIQQAQCDGHRIFPASTLSIVKMFDPTGSDLLYCARAISRYIEHTEHYRDHMLGLYLAVRPVDALN